MPRKYLCPRSSGSGFCPVEVYRIYRRIQSIREPMEEFKPLMVQKLVTDGWWCTHHGKVMSTRDTVV